jgi:ADP-heptose:LPS heptosyltransferase
VTHVLTCRLDSVGDVILQGPAIRAVAARADRVTLLCGPRGRAAAELLPGVDHIVVHSAPWIDPDPEPVRLERELAFVEAVAAVRPDEAIIFTSFHQNALPLALLLRFAGVRRIAAASTDYPGTLLDVRHESHDDLHEVTRSLELAAAAGYPLPRGDDGRLAVRRVGVLPPRIEPPYVVVHPGASVPARAWAPARHADLVRALSARGRQVLVTGGPGERALTALVAGTRGRARDLGGATDLAGLVEVIAGADAIVVGNTGPAHLAAAVGTPVVSLYAPTVPAIRWQPWRVPQVTLNERVPCAGCRARDCPVPGHPCLSGIGVEDVLDALDALELALPAKAAA